MTNKQKKMLFRIVLSAILTFVVIFLPVGKSVKLYLCIVPYLIAAYDILYNAVQGIINRQPFDENFLMAVASIGAFVLGEYIEGVFVVLLYQLGEFFQGYAVGKSRKRISDLMDIRPDCTYIDDGKGGLLKTDPYDVSVGDIVYVRSGDKIALDGEVVEGVSNVDTVALTGESVPRSVKPGDEVLSGCVNVGGMLKVRVKKEFDESTASKILDLVENAGSKKAGSEKFIKKFSRVYTPAVCLAACVLAVIPPLIIFLITKENAFTSWIYRALTFLVISCPCALVVSVPLTFFAGIGCAGKNGILIKGANHLEDLASAKYIVFDKTGTVTLGVFEVVGVHHNAIEKEKIIEYAALAESFSTHPISESLKKSYGKELDKSRVSCFTEISGMGVSAKVDGVSVLVGNSRLMKENGVDCVECTKNGTVVHVAADKNYLGHILISDIVKPNAKKCMSELKKAGIKKCVMLTGDRKNIGECVASEIGADYVITDLLPQQKVSEIERLLSEKQEKEKLVFVGDGINDAPVIARADVGIAMGALGSDAAIEASDVVIMDDDIGKLPVAVRFSKKCMSIVRQNIFFAIGIKALFLLLGSFGLSNMWLAVFADVGVMILAVLNAMRAMKI